MNITSQIKKELLKIVNNSKEKSGFGFWEEHIKYVVDNAI